MTTVESQDIILYAPRSNVLVAVLLGIICLPSGIALPFLAGWRLPALLISLFLIIVGIWLGPFFVWKLLHNPTLIINAEGICCLHPFFRIQIKWNEIDSIYCINSGAAFAVDLSPAGLVSFFSRQGGRIPQRLDITVPQQALSIQGINLPLPVDRLLTQVRERFSVQLERYNIDLDDEDDEDESEEDLEDAHGF